MTLPAINRSSAAGFSKEIDLPCDYISKRLASSPSGKSVCVLSRRQHLGGPKLHNKGRGDRDKHHPQDLGSEPLKLIDKRKMCSKFSVTDFLERNYTILVPFFPLLISVLQLHQHQKKKKMGKKKYKNKKIQTRKRTSPAIESQWKCVPIQMPTTRVRNVVKHVRFVGHGKVGLRSLQSSAPLPLLAFLCFNTFILFVCRNLACLAGWVFVCVPEHWTSTAEGASNLRPSITVHNLLLPSRLAQCEPPPPFLSNPPPWPYDVFRFPERIPVHFLAVIYSSSHSCCSFPFLTLSVE